MFKEPQIAQIKQMRSGLYVMIPVRYYTDSMLHASQVLTDTHAGRTTLESCEAFRRESV